MQAFLAQERLPAAYRATAVILDGIADRIVRRLERRRPQVVGVCGAQGSGKSTAASLLQLLLQQRGVRAAILSIDDLYLPRDDRQRIARRIHPLLATRGPPGTHDISLGCTIIDQLLRAPTCLVPRFDKALDERRPRQQWEVFEGPADVVLFEGWCVGAAPQAEDALRSPINDLEGQHDPHGQWRGFVNEALAHDYPALFHRIDALVLIKAPSFEVVTRWRQEQEAKLRSRLTDPMAKKGVMGEAEVARFVQHFERITRHILGEMPARADALLTMDTDRRIQRVELQRSI